MNMNMKCTDTTELRTWQYQAPRSGVFKGHCGQLWRCVLLMGEPYNDACQCCQPGIQRTPAS